MDKIILTIEQDSPDWWVVSSDCVLTYGEGETPQKAIDNFGHSLTEEFEYWRQSPAKNAPERLAAIEIFVKGEENEKVY